MPFIFPAKLTSFDRNFWMLPTHRPLFHHCLADHKSHLISLLQPPLLALSHKRSVILSSLWSWLSQLLWKHVWETKTRHVFVITVWQTLFCYNYFRRAKKCVLLLRNVRCSKMNNEIILHFFICLKNYWLATLEKDSFVLPTWASF